MGRLNKGAFRLTIKSAGMEMFPWWFVGHTMLSGRFRHERFTARARMGRKGDKSVIPRARSRRWIAFIAIFICHGEDGNGMFLHSVYWCAKTQVWMAFMVYRLSRLDAVIVVWMRPNRIQLITGGLRWKCATIVTKPKLLSLLFSKYCHKVKAKRRTSGYGCLNSECRYEARFHV